MATSNEAGMPPAPDIQSKPQLEEEDEADTNMPDTAAEDPKNSRKSYDASKRIMEQRQDDYYGILGLKEDCTPDQIKKRYKRLSLLTHPDRLNWPDAQEAY